MKKQIKRFFQTISIALLFPCYTFAQTPATMEQSLVEHIKNIQTYSTYGDNYQEALLNKESELFLKELLADTKQASTLQYDFPKLKKYITIATSSDKKLRVFSWDKENGGTMHEYGNVYQFLGDDGNVYSESNSFSEGDSGVNMMNVLDANMPNQSLYLLQSNATLSTSLSYESIKLVGIDGNKLNNKKLIKTKSGLTNTLGFEYDFFSVMDRAERPIKLTVYDKVSHTIKIPVVLADKKFNNGGRVTSKFITYRFDGTYFVKQ